MCDIVDDRVRMKSILRHYRQHKNLTEDSTILICTLHQTDDQSCKIEMWELNQTSKQVDLDKDCAIEIVFRVI